MKKHATIPPFFLLIATLTLLPCTDAFAKKVAIIGGGMAGVAAATFLKDTSHEVHLFEIGERIGGNAKTVIVKNTDGRRVAVDVGPQYFAEGPWDLYIDFLRYFGLYNPKEFISFDASVLIAKESKEWPVMATPRARLSHLAINVCRNNLANLKALKQLIEQSHALYTAPVPDMNLSVEEWLKEIDVDEKSKTEVFLPFLASILGTSIAQTKQLSAPSLANLYAFNAPTLCQKARFLVVKRGMGELINEIGVLIQKSKNIQIHTRTGVKRVSKIDNGYLVQFDNSTSMAFDAVIMATHAPEAAKIINQESLSAELDSLPYIDARLVLHTDHSRSFVDTEYPSYFNIILNEQGEVMSTMNLEEIDSDRYKGLLKSWVDSNEGYWLMTGVLHTEVFQHPLMTPYFLQTVQAIKKGLLNDSYSLGNGFALSGGWTETHETQNTAILSAYKAVSHLHLLSSSESFAWENRLRLWKKND